MKTPGTCGGHARIAGHRIRVADVARWHEHQGMSADEIVAQYPSLGLSDVHAALAYYFDHVTEIREELRQEEAAIEESRQQNPPLVAARREQLDEAS